MQNNHYIDNPLRPRDFNCYEEMAPEVLAKIGITDLKKNETESFKAFDFFAKIHGMDVRVEFQHCKTFFDEEGIFIPIKMHKFYNLKNNNVDLIVNVWKNQICLIFQKSRYHGKCNMEDYIDSMKTWGEHKEGMIMIPSKIINI